MALSNSLIVIIEDDIQVNNHIKNILSIHDVKVIQAFSGKEGLQLITSKVPDLVILDLGLDDIDGKDIIQNVRKWSLIPIIVLSGRTQEREKVAALDLGADDYVVKPFGSAELLARIKVALRLKKVSNINVVSSFVNRELKIDYDKRLVSIRGSVVHFTPIEYKILCLMASNCGRVLTYDYIIKNVWGPYLNEVHTLRVNMANIRKKLEINTAIPEYILTEVGVGYRLLEE